MNEISAPPSVQKTIAASPPASMLARLARAKGGKWGLALVAFWLIVFIVSLVWTPYDPFEFHFGDKLQPPSADFLLGTDKYGRDTLSRIMTGSREVILISTGGTLLAIALGLFIGITSGFFGHLYDEVIMRSMDIIMAFPSLLLALLVVGVLGPGELNVVLVIGVVFAPRIARVARSVVMELRVKEYVQAAQVRGDSVWNIMLVEMLPNMLGPLGVEAGVRFAHALFLSASLGFLGLGVQPPTPDWGLMVNEGRDFIEMSPWVSLFPAIAIATLVVGVNILSEAYRRVWAGES
ncbi:MAG: ABC transporter permease [Burkholderiaceae bacterium]|nr:ABC transporter permease [Burkholderiaceae bacterium]